MSAAPIPQNETQRLNALHDAAMLDTEHEFFFEEAVEAVSARIGAPIVVVSLIDQNRQWFKASRGLAAGETPRACAFCSYTIMSDEPFLVSDARQDERFAGNPLVFGEPHVIAYAGAPIILKNGARIGSVCAIDTQPHDWSAASISVLAEVAGLVGRYVDLRSALLRINRQRHMELALAGDTIAFLRQG